MEQISVLIGQYANGITVAAGVFAIILLAVTLHRIKRLEKTQRKVLESLYALRRENSFEEVQKVREAVTADGALQRTEAQPAGGGKLRTGAEPVTTGNGASAAEKQLPKDAAELLDAVLEEVFP